MKVRNVSPYGALDIPAAGLRFEAGETKEVPDELGAALIEQADNFERVVAPAAKKGE